MTADPELVARALAEVSALGPYFEIFTGPGPEDHAWRPLSELHTDTGALEARITDFEGRLGTSESRVAASILFQGIAARLWSPVVGAVTAHRLLPVAPSAELRWRPVATGPLPLWTPPTASWALVPGEWPDGGNGLADGERVRLRNELGKADGVGELGAVGEVGEVGELVYRAVVTEVLEPLVGAVRSITRIAPPLLWGNAASALAGTLRTLPPARPDLAPRAAALVRDVLSLGVLAGTGRLAEPAPGAYFFVRTSCCLYYRVPGGGMCDDCVLLDPAVRDDQWARAGRAVRRTR